MNLQGLKVQFHDPARAREAVFFCQYMVVNWLAKHLCLSNWAGEKLPKSDELKVQNVYIQLSVNYSLFYSGYF